MELKQRIFKNIHSCNWCRYRTKSIYFIKSHVQRHKVERTPELFSCMNGAPELYKCCSCDYETHLIVNLKRHLKEIHKFSSAVKTEVCYCEEPDSFTQDKFLKTYNCRNCRFETSSHLMCLKHIWSKCSVDRQCENYPLIRFQCQQQCLFKSKRKETLERHLLLNHKKHILSQHSTPKNIQWFECEHCSYKTKFVHNMKRHVRVKHSNAKDSQWFECENCSYKAHMKYLLEGHIRSKHLDCKEVNWFECHHCSTKTKQKSTLKQHILTQHANSKDKWFECGHCSYKTNLAYNLKRHIGVKHSASKDIQWIECEDCPYKTKFGSNLKRHILRHHSF